MRTILSKRQVREWIDKNPEKTVLQIERGVWSMLTANGEVAAAIDVGATDTESTHGDLVSLLFAKFLMDEFKAELGKLAKSKFAHAFTGFGLNGDGHIDGGWGIDYGECIAAAIGFNASVFKLSHDDVIIKIEPLEKHHYYHGFIKGVTAKSKEIGWWH